jgi:hypothetical protein
MKTILLSAVLVAFAAPALADEQPATQDERLGSLELVTITAIKEQPAEPAATDRLVNLEHMTITAIKDDEPVTQRLMEFQQVTGTAKKDQPAEHAVDSETTALLAEIAQAEE